MPGWLGAHLGVAFDGPGVHGLGVRIMRRETRNAIALAAIGTGLLSIAGCNTVSRDASAVVYAEPGKNLSDAMKAGTQLTSVAQYYDYSSVVNDSTPQETEVKVKPNSAGALDLTWSPNPAVKATQTFSFASSDYATGGTFFPGGTVATQSGSGYVSFQSYLRNTQDLFNGVAPGPGDYHYLDAAEFEVLRSSGNYQEGTFVYGVETRPENYRAGSATYNGTFRINAANSSGSPIDSYLTGTAAATVHFAATPTADVTLDLTRVQTPTTTFAPTSTATLSGSGTLLKTDGIALTADSNFNTLFPGSSANLTGKLYGPAAEEFGGEIGYTSDTLVGHGYAVGKR